MVFVTYSSCLSECIATVYDVHVVLRSWGVRVGEGVGEGGGGAGEVTGSLLSKYERGRRRRRRSP